MLKNSKINKIKGVVILNSYN